MTQASRAPRLTALARRHGLAAAVLLIFVYLVLRSTGLYPLVFADEWAYSSAARLLPAAQAIVPSWLYLWLFGLTSACGNGFLDCARIVNALLFVASAPFLYQLARQVASERVAAVVTVLSLLAPVNSYTAYFMPEAMYFFGFAVLSWVVLCYRQWSPLRYGLLTGAVLGALSTVKVHGVFLLPPLLAYMLFLSWSGGRGWPLRWLKMALAALAAVWVVKAGLGYLAAGKAGLSLFGSFYGDHASNSGRSPLHLLAPALTSLRGHAMALVLLLALPLSGLLLALLSGAARRSAPAPLRHLQVYGGLMLGSVLGVTVLYTATLVDIGPDELYRLHQRYYDFVFPLLVMMAAPLAAGPVQGGRRAGLAAALLVAAGLVAAALTLLPTFKPGMVDGPEIQILATSQHALRLVAALQIALLLVWLRNRGLAARLYLFALLPLITLAGDIGVRHMLARAHAADIYDSAALAARALLTPEQRGRVIVFGEGGGLLRAMFHLDRADALYVDLPPGMPVMASDVPPDHDWLLVVGRHPLDPAIKAQVQGYGFVLARHGVAHTALASVDMAQPLAGGVLTRVEGLAPSEPWGAWSVGKEVRMTFAAPLPAKLSLLIRASAFGPNVNADVVVEVGGQRQSFRLTGAPQDRVLQFDTDGQQTALTFVVPRPASPQSLGQGSDVRTLGIALSRFEIGRSE